jgi:uncharacterized phage protein (predicted DNA packaging)
MIAHSYILGAVEVDSELKLLEDKRFNYLKALLIAHYYENRNATQDYQLFEPPFSVVSFIQQLRGEY